MVRSLRACPTATRATDIRSQRCPFEGAGLGPRSSFPASRRCLRRQWKDSSRRRIQFPAEAAPFCAGIEGRPFWQDGDVGGEDAVEDGPIHRTGERYFEPFDI